MTSVLSRTAALSCAAPNTIPKSSAAKPLSNLRCANLIAPFMFSDSESIFLVKILRKLKPYGLSNACCFQCSHFVARASVGSGSGYTSDSDDDDLPRESDAQDGSIVIEIEKTSKNSRRITSKIGIHASLQTVWDILTDYERLADFIPGLAVSKLLEKRDNFARLFQIGEQDLAFGLKFNAKGTIDCVERDLETLPFGRKRDIEFKMVEGDFQLFEGTWSVEQFSDAESMSESLTTLVYSVHVKPKAWLPVRLVEGRLCNEIRTNLSCIREEAEKAYRNANSVVVED